MEYHWNFGGLLRFSELWAQGIVTTILLTIPILLIGTILACLLVIGDKSRLLPIRIICRAYINVFRAIPALVLIGTVYFCLPIILGLRVGAIETAIVALSLNLAPFAAELIRSAIGSIPRLQYDSARVMGFTGWKLTYYIIGPQIIRRITPPLVNEYITTLKLTSLAATIGVPEIWHVTGQVVTATSLPLEARIVGALLYVAIILPLLYFSMWIEKKFKVKGLGDLMER